MTDAGEFFGEVLTKGEVMQTHLHVTQIQINLLHNKKPVTYR
ncbi:hypothetical protein [Paenalkalicoccus suaedae]|nr:hypothetical protein [Paenalkalicoccus suaedae]